MLRLRRVTDEFVFAEQHLLLLRAELVAHDSQYIGGEEPTTPHDGSMILMKFKSINRKRTQ